MKLSTMSAAALAASTFASPLHSNDDTNDAASASTFPVRVAMPNPHRRWYWDCHKWCRQYEDYDNCYKICSRGGGSSTNTDSPSSSDFYETDLEERSLDPLDEMDGSPQDHVVVDGKLVAVEERPVGSDSGLSASDEMLAAHLGAVLESIMAYGDIHLRLNNIHNSVERVESAGDVSDWLEETLEDWLDGFKKMLDGLDDSRAWVEGLYEQVEQSTNATAQLYAQQFEAVARRDTEREMEDMVRDATEEQKDVIKASVRQAWSEQSGLPAWGVKSAVAASEE